MYNSIPISCVQLSVLADTTEGIPVSEKNTFTCLFFGMALLTFPSHIMQDFLYKEPFPR